LQRKLVTGYHGCIGKGSIGYRQQGRILKVIDMVSIRRECPLESYVSLFIIQELLRLPYREGLLLQGKNMKKLKKLIPKGYYCYSVKNGKTIPCPYWSIDKKHSKQNNGYCAYLEKGDWDINKESRWREVKYVNGKKKKGKTSTAEEIGIPMSLLWDMCKDCGIKE
jgi:hypothetical protein